MSDRPFPPSAKRWAEARRAGRVAWSPALVAGGAIAGGAAAVAMIGRAWVAEAGDGIRRGVGSARLADPDVGAHGSIVATVIAMAAPVLIVVAGVAMVAHVAQTRGGWIPRRASKLPSADGAARRGGLALLGLARAIVVALVAAALLVPAMTVLAGAGLGAGALGGQLAITLLAASGAAVLALGVLDWLERGRRLRADLSMTSREVRDERREAEGDPAAKRARAQSLRPTDDDAVRKAIAVVTAGDRAAAIAWHPRWQPIPRVTAAASGRAGTRLAALARRHRVAILHDAHLAPALVEVGAGGVIPERLHPEVARVVVALS